MPPTDPSLTQSVERIDAHLRTLAEDIGPRNIVRAPASLERAATYIESEWTRQGWTVERQSVIQGRVGVNGTFTDVDTYNLYIRIPGVRPPIVVGAHYDTYGATPGADDNASGVAALLELTHQIDRTTDGREVIFIAWTNEEPPFFRGEHQGSAVHATSLDAVHGAISLEMLGYYATEPKTQRVPFPLSPFYPNTGDFVMFVANPRSRRWVREASRAFRDVEPFPSRGITAPRWVQGIDWSDHRSYWSKAPAIMLTDTSFLRNDHYHQTTDTVETLDVERLARVTRGVVGMVDALRTVDARSPSTASEDSSGQSGD